MDTQPEDGLFVRLMTGLGSPFPTIGGCAQRADRAAKRYIELEALIHESVVPLFTSSPMCLSFPQHPVESLAGIHLIIPPDLEQELAMPLEQANALASEVLHYTRSALDHLVTFLDWRDSGRQNHRVQFFLTSDPAVWRRQCSRALSGINEDHLRVLQSIQPFEGVHWTEQLRRLSNLDKHSHELRVSPFITFALAPDSAQKGGSPIEGHDYLVVGRDPQLEFQLVSGWDLRPDADSVPLKVLDEILDGVIPLIMRFIEEFAGDS